MLIKLWVTNDISNIQSVKEDQCKNILLMCSTTIFKILPVLTKLEKNHYFPPVLVIFQHLPLF